MENNQERELNCPIDDDCNLVFTCDTCVKWNGDILKEEHLIYDH